MEQELKYDVKKNKRERTRRIAKKDSPTNEKIWGHEGGRREICECSLRHVQSHGKKIKKGGIKAIQAVKMGYSHGQRRKLLTPGTRIGNQTRNNREKSKRGRFDWVFVGQSRSV